MKYLSLFVGLLLWGMAATAQDIIIKKNGDEVQAKVLEVSTTEVKYKKFDNPDGPLYSVAKSEVFMIRYANGTKEVINAQPAKPSSGSSNQSSGSGDGTRIEQRGSAYYQNGVRLNEKDLYRIVTTSGNTKASREMKSGYPLRKAGGPLVGIGIPFAAVGLVGVVVGTALVLTYDEYDGTGYYSSNGTYYSGYNQSDYDNYVAGGVIQTVGFVFSAVGIASLTTGIILKNVGKKRIQQAVDSYNAGLGN